MPFKIIYVCSNDGVHTEGAINRKRRALQIGSIGRLDANFVRSYWRTKFFKKSKQFIPVVNNTLLSVTHT